MSTDLRAALPSALRSAYWEKFPNATEADWEADADYLLELPQMRQALATDSSVITPEPAPALDLPPETEAVRRCVTHHACTCHTRLAEIGRRYLAMTKEQP